jgi:hypothetical protein
VKAPAACSMSTTLKVLLVEDDPEVLLGTKQALELAGFEVEPLTDAETPPKRPQVRTLAGTTGGLVSLVPQPDSCTAVMTKRCPHFGRPAAYKARGVISSQSFGPEP